MLTGFLLLQNNVFSICIFFVEVLFNVFNKYPFNFIISQKTLLTL